MSTEGVSFFTAVKYSNQNKTWAQAVLEGVDNYFYLGGKKAHVIDCYNTKEEVLLCETNSSMLARAFKVASYVAVPFSLGMLILKLVLRSSHTFKVIDPRQKLEKGIKITQDIKKEIQALLPKIDAKEDDEAIEWISKETDIAFKLKSKPKLIFKMPGKRFQTDVRTDKTRNLPDNTRAEMLFSNIVEVKKICLANHLDFLEVPASQLVETNSKEDDSGDTYTFIAQRSFDLLQEEQPVKKYDSDLSCARICLANLVSNGGYKVTQKDVALLQYEKLTYGKSLVLVNPEYMGHNSKHKESNYAQVLEFAFSEYQIDQIITELRKQDLSWSSKQAEKAKETRLNALKDESLLKAFYEKNNIQGSEPIKVDIDTLGLSLDKVHTT